MSHHPAPIRRKLLRLGAAGLIGEILQERGLPPEAAFGRTWFARRMLVHPEPVVPLVWLGRFFQAGAAATAQDEFGLLVGLRAASRLTDWSEGSTPDDVGAALMRIISRSPSFPNACLTLNVSGNICMIGCQAFPRNMIGRDQLADCALGFADGAMRALCGPRWRPLRFHFVRHPPPDLSRHAALLMAPISYNVDVTAMEFESAWLDRNYTVQQRSASPDFHEQRLHGDIASDVREALASWAATSPPSAPAIARKLGLQQRTLNRLLEKTGTSLNHIITESKYERARGMLQDPAATIVSVAWSLGYGDARAFSRAFRRWSGVTPTEWRNTTGQS